MKAENTKAPITIIETRFRSEKSADSELEGPSTSKRIFAEILPLPILPTSK